MIFCLSRPCSYSGYTFSTLPASVEAAFACNDLLFFQHGQPAGQEITAWTAFSATVLPSGG